MPKQLVFTIVLFVHNLCTVLWVGGMMALGFTVIPSAKQVLGMGPQTKKLMDSIQKHLSRIVYVCIVLLIATGLLMAKRSPAFQGLFHFGNPYATALSVKHILTILMVAIALVRSIVLGPKEGPAAQQQEKLKNALLFVNIALGLVVLFLSAYCTAVG